MQLGRYKILKQLSTGTVADVLLARASGLEGFARHVVIKRIRAELASERKLVEAFLEEARIAASLHHQNIVQVHDIGEQDGAYFFAMEYVHGEDVGKLLHKARERGEQVPFDLVVAIVTATAAGLHHAHEQRNATGQPLDLVHRDVTPANILIGYDGSVKLVDFGMTKAAHATTKTASATFKGKASYLAPEQCIGKPIDRRTDVFSLGIVLYELATSCRLFKAANDFLTMAAIVEGEVPAPSTLRSEIPPALDAIILRALAREPASRYQTVEDLREALERYAFEYELRTSNKALADYMNALFGQRPEPWEDDEASFVGALPDPTHAKGLVAPPVENVIKKYAPRATSPIMLAQALADESDEFVEEGATTVMPSKSAPVQTQSAPPNALENDQFSRTVVTPPPEFGPEPDEPEPESETATPALAVDTATPVEALTIPGADTATPARGIDVETETPIRMVDVDIDQPRPRSVNIPQAVSPAPGPYADDGLIPRPEPLVRGDQGPPEPPPRPASEVLYVGPPAPRRARLRRFLALYGRSIMVGAGAGFLVVAMATLVFRACTPERPRPPSAPRSGAVEPQK